MKIILNPLLRPIGLLLLLASTVQAVEIKLGFNFSMIHPTTPSVALLIPPQAPTQAFPGFIIMPVDVVSTDGRPVVTEGLRVDYLFSVSTVDGKVKIPQTAVPVRFEPTSDPAKLRGTAVVSSAELRTVEAGDVIHYNFRVQQRGGIPPSAISDVTFIKKLRLPVYDGTRVTVPSLNFVTGATTLYFRPGSLPTNGTLEIEQDPTLELAAGPQGTSAASGTVYKFSLDGTTLKGPMELQLAVPSEADGSLVSSHAGAGGGPTASINDLAPYWLEKNPVTGQIYGWRRIGRPQIDTAQRSVKVQTSRTGTFALFPTGPGTAADYRPKERIITPNSDGINDVAQFFGVNFDDQVKIFDMRGRPVKTLPGPDPIWDGSEENGHTAESGVYIYQYTSNGERVSGVIAIAK